MDGKRSGVILVRDTKPNAITTMTQTMMVSGFLTLYFDISWLTFSLDFFAAANSGMLISGHKDPVSLMYYYSIFFKGLASIYEKTYYYLAGTYGKHFCRVIRAIRCVLLSGWHG